ncbi:DUF3054 domain-containing protein [Actinomadura sp. WMMB 499]|uniref:DUF3054 domain-containing protein n=1 Tax=Actinomadura sp. WMMB 499 TaxID=1219491 RepID=UPI001248D21A|nr:DUF3054 domain-containing protein [Actinomadura sp. WMMB 499]QFG25071.1 DUF3054 domain-containing protein [Actinomadura sp. WMMB 499]
MQRTVLAGIADAACLVAFVVIGRAEHDGSGGLSGFAATFWPFLAGGAAGWLIGRVWRRPEAVVPAGVVVWVSTVAVGMLLRAVSGQGTAAAFVIVSLIFLGVTMLGWRGIAMLRGRKAATSE